MKLIFTITLLFVLIIPCSLQAQRSNTTENTKLQADRPDLSQGPTIVLPGTLQIETGYLYQKDNSAGHKQKEYYYPTTLFRFGILKNAELRLNVDYRETKDIQVGGDQDGMTEDEKGFSDVQIGTKIKLYRGQGFIPTIGLFGNITLPVGNTSFHSPHIVPGFGLSFSSKISEKIELQYNVGYLKAKVQETYQGGAVYAVSGAIELTDNLAFYGEVYGQKLRNSLVDNRIDSGFVFRLLPVLLFDVIGGVGITEAAPDVFAGGGVTWQIIR